MLFEIMHLSMIKSLQVLGVIPDMTGMMGKVLSNNTCEPSDGDGGAATTLRRPFRALPTQPPHKPQHLATGLPSKFDSAPYNEKIGDRPAQ